MMLALNTTGNAELLAPWAASLTSPFDMNSGMAEADNLGETLMVLTLARDSPLVSGVIAAAANFTRRNPATGLLYLNGSVDGGPKPVYATKWLKLGLEALGLHKESRRYGVPEVGDDTYSLLFWEGLTASKPVPTGPAVRCDPYPYLTWAADHFLGTTTAKLNGVLYLLRQAFLLILSPFRLTDFFDGAGTR